MNWIFGIVIVVAILLIFKRCIEHQKRRKLRLFIQDNWGLPKEDEYYNFDTIGLYFRNNNDLKNAYQIISDSTWDDLDMDEVFRYIDRTCSKIGQQYLYRQLRTVTSISSLKRFGNFSRMFGSDEALRVDSQQELCQLSSYKSYYLEELFRPEPTEKSGKIWIVYLLSTLAILSVILSFYYPIVSLTLIPVFVCNMVFHYRNKNVIQYYLNGVGQLSVSYRVANKLITFSKIRSYHKDFGFMSNIKPVLSKARFIEWEKKLDNEYAALFWLMTELLKITFNIEFILFYHFQASLEKEKANIRKLFSFIGEVDSAISCASLYHGHHKICEPVFSGDKSIVVEGLYHPLIENCITNDLALKNRSLLLTGSNMSGKTTFIRSFSINAILSQTINVCFADRYIAPFLKIYSSIRISDNLMKNTSYYLQEVLTIKNLIETSEDETPCLFVLDELFKGTNTVERIAAGKAILSYLNKANHIVMVSTHDLELTELLENENFELYHFAESIENNSLIFDHKLRPGRLRTRNAIKILELYDYPIEIIKESEVCAKNWGYLHNVDKPSL
ncbi:MutS-related protein [Sinomicrobium soli]|uniref:MutS-related protein n=1 Tax=Sinomicrobium sp. N-1-3-6 TaxID=2219864 RepID=UPI000DCEBB31|nr:DNA mismatch repair protein MutS [Sinomicrobium sp. N-1-3-6]RAV28510.1 DNA mismatch repair protein MutS [Sinomicrobium sp. N-1-3-6]